MTTLSLNVSRYAANPVSSIPVPAFTTGKNNRTRAVVATRNSSGLLTRALQWLRTSAVRSSKKRMQMIETVSLGEKRFVALVQVDDRHFLIGGASTNVGMLAEIGSGQTVAEALNETAAEAKTEIKTEAQPEPDFQAELLAATKIATALEAPAGPLTAFEIPEENLVPEEFILPEAKVEQVQFLQDSQIDAIDLLANDSAAIEDHCALTTAAAPTTESVIEPVFDFIPANLASPIFYMQTAWTPELQGATS